MASVPRPPAPSTFRSRGSLQSATAHLGAESLGAACAVARGMRQCTSLEQRRTATHNARRQHTCDTTDTTAMATLSPPCAAPPPAFVLCQQPSNADCTASVMMASSVHPHLARTPSPRRPAPPTAKAACSGGCGAPH